MKTKANSNYKNEKNEFAKTLTKSDNRPIYIVFDLHNSPKTDRKEYSIEQLQNILVITTLLERI